MNHTPCNVKIDTPITCSMSSKSKFLPHCKFMATLYLNNTPYYASLSSKCSTFHKIDLYTKLGTISKTTTNIKPRLITNRRNYSIRAIGTVPERDQAIEDEDLEEDDGPPCIGFGFVSPVLLPDGTPDMHMRTATGGQKLRDIMLDNYIDLYGPYSRPLLNCAGGGTCGSCMVEVVEGKELLSRKTDKEKEHLKKKPKNWRLACQATVGTPDSRGMVVIQQLPEWKAHEWNYTKGKPNNNVSE